MGVPVSADHTAAAVSVDRRWREKLERRADQLQVEAVELSNRANVLPDNDEFGQLCGQQSSRNRFAVQVLRELAR